jgi:hypothetical protein
MNNPGSGVTSTTLSCYSLPGWSFDYHSGGPYGGTVIYYFVAGSVGDSSLTGTNWNAALYYDFSDPYTAYSDYLYATVLVTHSDRSQNQYTIINHHGGDGTVTCDYVGVNFTAQNGDTIEIDITGVNAFGASIKSSYPILFRYV